MKKFILFGTLAIALGLLLNGEASNAAATKQETWNKKHPRRHQVNKRLNRQNNQVNKALTSKKLTYQQGSKIKAQDQKIHQEERDMASMDGGHITKKDQRALNQQENKVHREIVTDEKANGN